MKLTIETKSIKITLTRRRNERQTQAQTGPLSAGYEPAGNAAGADDPFPQESRQQASLSGPGGARLIEVPAIAIQLARIALETQDEAGLQEQMAHLSRAFGYHISNLALHLADEQMDAEMWRQQQENLWSVPADRYQLTDDDMEYRIRCMDEDGEL